MPVGLEVATYLAAQGLGTLGVNVFVGQLKDTPDVALMVSEYGGASSNHGFGNPGLREEFSGVQILVRGLPNDYAGPRARIETAYRKMAEIQATTLSGTYYRIARPVSPPLLLERDANMRCKFVVSFICDKTLSAS